MLSAGATEVAAPPRPPPGDAEPRAPFASDRARLTAIAEANYDFVWRTLRRLGLPPAASDDATQQVFLVLARRLGELADGAERTFLYRTAALVALESRRKHGQSREQGSADVVDGTPDSAPGPEELTDQKQKRALLDEALSSLDDDLRAVFVLFEIEGMSLAEMTALLAIPQGTVSSRLRRAREQFKDAVTRIRARRPNLGRKP